MFYPHPQLQDTVEFSGDLNNFVSAHKYRIYAPDDKLLDLVSNIIVPTRNRFKVGKLRLTECRLPLPGKKVTSPQFMYQLILEGQAVLCSSCAVSVVKP